MLITASTAEPNVQARTSYDVGLRMRNDADEEVNQLRRRVYKCMKCRGLYPPSTFLVGGNQKTKIWVVGINPKESKKRRKELGKLEYHGPDGVRLYEETYFKEEKEVYRKYYGPFQHVFGSNWLEYFQKYVCHTDLVKCASDKKPEDKDWKEAVGNCSDFLVRQIELLKPKLLVCNGKPVCEWFKESFKKKEEEKEEKKATWGQFETKKGDHTFYVVYSGFIGQIDKWARRRLGVEIENQARKLGIWPSA